MSAAGFLFAIPGVTLVSTEWRQQKGGRMSDHDQNEFGQPIGAPLEVDLPCPMPPRTPLLGQHCRLEPTCAEHAPGLFAGFSTASDDADWTYLPSGPFTGQAAFCDWLTTTCLGADPQFHTVLTASGTPVGLASYLRIKPATGVIEIGNLHFSRGLQRTPASTEVIYLMMARAFDELGYRRFEWKCDALNAPSRRAAERFGFRYEGCFRQHLHYKGRNRDTAWYAILNTEWPAQKARFEAWLNPANFTANGQQRTPLARG
jgi:RimJ/RimL family protein N-acetyltransferase